MTKFYCPRCKAPSITTPHSVTRTKNNRYQAKGTCDRCKTNMSTLVSNQEGEGLLSMLGIDSGPLKNIPVLGAILG